MNAGEVRVWDPLVRALHWSLVLLCGAVWSTAERAAYAHEALGMAVAAIVGLRLLWGVIGTRHARFGQFVRPPRVALYYLLDAAKGRARRYVGHNPARGLSIVPMIAALAIVAASGWAYAHGPLTGAHWIEETHEFAAALLAMLVAVHLVCVLFSSMLAGENLVRSMFTGRKSIH
jgi:cytochrome b